MATYRQDITYYEDGYGDVTINIIVADSYDNIFAASSKPTDVIEFSDIDFKNEAAIGQLSTDQANFEIDESTFSYDDDVVIDATDTQQDIDNEVLTLCKNSTKTSPSYIGVFLNTASTADIDDKLFIGAIDYDYEQEDLGWSGTEFSTTASPVAKYKFTTTPAQEALFDAISLQSVIDGVESTLITNAIDGAGFYSDGDYATKVPGMINLNVLLHNIANSYEAELSSAGYGTFNISFSECELDGQWLPTRWKLAKPSQLYGQIVDWVEVTDTVAKDQDQYAEYNYSDATKIKLVGTSSSSLDGYSAFHVNINNVIKAESLGVSYRNEVYPDTAEDSFLWQNNPRVDDSFTNLLYALATDFGLKLELTFTNQTDIQINFKPNSELDTTQLYIKDVEKSSSKRFGLEEREADKRVIGVTSYLSLEADNNPIPNKALPQHTAEPTPDFNNKKSGQNSLVGIGPILWRTNDTIRYNNSDNGIIQKSGADIYSMKGMTIPYNTILTNSGSEVNYVQYNSTSLTTQLFMYVDKLAGESYAPASYYTPVFIYTVEQDGNTRAFSRLEIYRDTVNNYDIREYGKELSLTVPFLMAFSTSSSGTSPSIKNLGLNKKIVYDTVEYVITGYKINLQDKKVELSLENTGRFDYSNVISITDGNKKNSSVQSTDEEDEETVTFTYTADGAISQGEFVSLKTASTVERSQASNTHYNRLLGVALNDAADTEGVSVQVSGKVSISWLTGSVNDAVYIRDISSTENLSTTSLTGVSGSEDLLAQVGTITDTNEMRINIKEHFVLT